MPSVKTGDNCERLRVTSTLDTVDLPRGVRVLESVADALMKLFGESLAVQSRVDPDAILETVTSVISLQVPATCMAILMKSDPGTSRVVVADKLNPRMATYIDDYVATLFSPHEAPTTGLSQRVIEAGGPIFKPGMGIDQFLPLISPEGRAYIAAHPLPIAFNSVDLLMVAMRSGPAIVGTLALFDWVGDGELSEADIEWVQRVADRIGLTIDNAQLRNRAIDRIERLMALSDVALAIASSQDLRVTLKLILERTIATLRVDAADVLLVDETDNTFYVAASAGFRATSNTELRFPIPQETANRALFDRKALPAGSEWMGSQRRWIVAREGLKTYTAAPLTVREKLVGAIELFSRTTLDLDPEWLSFFDAMANHVAIGVDNATMYNELQRNGQVHPAQRIPAPILSDREREILAQVVNGASNREVAERLHLSHNTIKFHIRQLLEKAQVSNRTELATKAVQQGWL
jgi:DNA-binding CsgD family transcriptional regulator